MNELGGAGPMVVDITGQVLALSGLTVVGLLFNRLLRLELTLACMLAGFLAGLAIGAIDFDTGIRAESLQDLVFFVILPVLVFEAAWHIEPHRLKQWLTPILILAIPGVIISAAITAALVYVGIGHPQGFPWIAALLTGAILSATDPVAVTSKLRALDAPQDLSTLFEGESLFNDATVIVLFTLLLNIALQPVPEAISYIGFFSRVFFGGMLCGLICGLVTAAVILLLRNPVASRFILVFSAFASFYLAEHLLHVSGIMAVMVAALVTRCSLKKVEDTIASGVASTWEWLGLYFNNLLFTIMGLVIVVAMFQEQWLAMVIAISASLLARLIAVLTSAFFSQYLGTPVPRGWQVLLVWGGLRGAIAIALVLSLPVSLSYWWTIQSMVFGVVLFSLLVQGSTTGLLIRKYGQPIPHSDPG